MLSIIVPFVNEYPQIIFTLQSLFNEIRDMDAEIIAIDNFTPEIEEQQYENLQQICPSCFNEISIYRERDCGGMQVKKYSKIIPNLIYAAYPNKLSHWNAKRVGVGRSKGDVLLFVDAHVVPTPGSVKKLYDGFNRYGTVYGDTFTFHFPLTYMLDLKHQLKYQLDVDPSRSYYGYTFCGYTPTADVEEVPCMSTCGMMISRSLYDRINGWPKELGIYGGGENYMNFVLSVIGAKKYIAPVGPLYHYAAPRGYYYNYDDFIRNRAIAAMMITGEQAAARCYLSNCQGNAQRLDEIYYSIIEGGAGEENCKHLEHINNLRTMSIRSWLDNMQSTGLYNGEISKREYVS